MNATCSLPTVASKIARDARSILDAWACGDLQRLKRTVARVTRLQSFCGDGCTYEEENRDLLCGAAERMADILWGGAAARHADLTAIETSIRMLRHLSGGATLQ